MATAPHRQHDRQPRVPRRRITSTPASSRCARATTTRWSRPTACSRPPTARSRSRRPTTRSTSSCSTRWGSPQLRDASRTSAPTRDRFERRAAINALVNAETRKQPIAHWLDVLNAAGVPCGRVMSLPEVFADPQVRHQQMRSRSTHPVHGPLDVLGFPIKFTDDPCRVHRPPPDPRRGHGRAPARAGLQRRRDRALARARRRRA